MPAVTASLVVYRTPVDQLVPLLSTLSGRPGLTWAVVDNAAMENPELAAALRQAIVDKGGRYLPSTNIGFGAAHNLALHSLGDVRSDFHLIVNPDIHFGPEVLTELLRSFEEHPEAVWVMPKVLYPDGRTQPLCKLLPAPLDLACRRFLPRAFSGLIAATTARYELHGIEDSTSLSVPFLSGCFALIRRDVLEAVGGFDDRYFMYMEDVDLCRRVSRHGRLLYWPRVSVTHGFDRGSHHNLRLTLRHLHSSVLYFLRWGWFFDADRRRANAAALKELAEIRRRRS